MAQWKRWPAILAAAAIVLFFIFMGLSYFFSDFIIEIWWFASVGYEAYFWQRFLYKYAVFAAVSLFFFLIFFLNFWVASRYLGSTHPPDSPDSQTSYRNLLVMFRTGSMWIYTPLSIILAVMIALPLYREWESFLLFLFAPNSGIADPVYGKEISYYLFSYPIYIHIQRRLLITFGILLAGLASLYWIERRILARQERRLHIGAMIHLNIVVLLVFLIEIWNFLLQRYGLLYTTTHLPLFYGPGYVEMNVVFVFIWICIALLAATALSFAYLINTHKQVKIVGIAAALTILAVFVRYSDFIPGIVEKYIVKPNELAKELPYINNNIKSTLASYRLEEVETRDFYPEQVPAELSIPDIKTTLRNIPVWDGDILDVVFKQLQELRTYYDFPTVHVDRYTVNNLYQQVFLAARELPHSQLPEAARNWVNQRFMYTHGFGPVMTPASQGGDEAMIWFIRGIPPESDYGFKIEQPEIYFGQVNNDYVIAPNDFGELNFPKGISNVMTSYSGTGGVPIDSIFRRFVFSVHFWDRNLLFTAKMNPKSRVLFRQNIRERIQILAPYLLLDRFPYLVVTNQRLYWIQDAYTASNHWPISMPFKTDTGGELNYIRNSVKIVVDAYNGDVNFYIFDPKDPIINAYSRIYPGVFQEAEKMPEELKPHVRYPQDIFQIQMDIYRKYHMTDPETFYQHEDIWDFASTFKGTKAAATEPYYLTVDIIEPGRFDFLLLQPMSPLARDNLRALTLVDCDRPNYGKIIVFNFPKGELVYGPSQIYALINQDPKISQQFTLWGQVGSQVDRGRMLIIPVKNVILYIQAVYLRSSTKLNIPELKRLIVSQGQFVVMAPSLEEAYTEVREKIKTEVERAEKRYAPLTPAKPPGESSAPK